MNEYDVSIIVPIYNSEKYISYCVKTILNQDYYDLSRLEMILVNDGSTDDSLKICNKLKEEVKEFTIEIITGENAGVSNARNKGIRSAKGKYIMFLDSDDILSKNAIRKLVDFFDKHYDEVDLVTYPLYTFQNSKKKKILPRYKEFKETKIYDLEKDFWAIQPTMNVMVKNIYENNVLFNENIFFHEDLLYNTRIITQKLKMGYIKEARYYYRIYDNSVTNYKENPLYSFEQFMYVSEYLFNNYRDKDGNIPKYIQRIILNVIRYRIEKDKLFPYYLQGEEWDKAYQRIISIIKKIDNENIISYNQMDRYHKMYLLRLKGIDFNIYTNHYNNFTINDDDEILDIITNIEIIINRFKVKNKKIQILAFLKSPLLQFIKPKIYIKYTTVNGENFEEEINLHNTVASRYKANIEVAKFYMFEYEINMQNIKKFKFRIQIGEINNMPVRIYFNKWASFNNKIKPYKIYDGDYRVQSKEKEFWICKPKEQTRKRELKQNTIKYSETNKKIRFFRNLAKITNPKDKKIWLYYDRKNVFDNGYSQFKHDVKINDNINKYYIVDGNIRNFKGKFSKKECKNVVKFGSLKHKLLFLNSDKILTSFSSIQDYCPFCKNFEYYKDILKYDLIYLQHGILHARLLKMYAKIFTQIDKFVVSSNFEKENLINNYDYNEKDLIEVGMPRLDEQADIREPENKIIYAPSWRRYLIGEIKSKKRKINKEKFIKSKYYTEIVNFLRSDKLISSLKESNTILDLKLHPIFEPYKECFDSVINENVTVSIGNVELDRYKAFITDFSSFQFDFVNIKRPIVYFVPDMTEFRAGLHTYRELDLEYEKAFGKLCLTSEELLNEVIKLINNNFTVESIYKERMDKFFFKVDNRRDKLYEILKND